MKLSKISVQQGLRGNLGSKSAAHSGLHRHQGWLSDMAYGTVALRYPGRCSTKGGNPRMHWLARTAHRGFEDATNAGTAPHARPGLTQQDEATV